MSENQELNGAAVLAAPAPESLPEAAISYFNSFHAWCLALSADDARQVLPILQTIRMAHNK